MDRKLVKLYEEVQSFNYQKPKLSHQDELLNRRVKDSKDNISSAINGLINYFKMLERQNERDSSNVSHVEALEQLAKFSSTQLGQFREFKSAEESFE